MPHTRMIDLLRENRTLLVIVAIGVLLVEVEIFALAVMKSGRKSWLQVYDQGGSLIHETNGQRLSDFNKYYFEKTFGPFEQYDVKLVTRQRPFPFRAWFVAAVGLPVGAVLLFGFIVQAYATLVYGQRRAGGSQPQTGLQRDEAQTRLERVVQRASRLNIFVIGIFVLIAVLAYWTVPNLITYLGRVGVDALVRFKWLFIAAAGFLAVAVLWIIYLRFLLARQTIASQAEVEKMRLQLEYQRGESADVPLIASVPETEYALEGKAPADPEPETGRFHADRHYP